MTETENTYIVSEVAKVKRRILQTARDQFMEMGFSKVTMDELARLLGMSKKTVYKYFPSKQELVMEVVRFQVGEVSRGLRAIVADRELPFHEKLSRVIHYFGTAWKPPSARFLEDARKQKDVWEELDQLRMVELSRNFSELLRDGRKEGLIRSDVEPELLTRMLKVMVQGMINPEMLSEMPMTAGQMARRILELFSLGIMTNEGRKLFLEEERTIQERS